MAVNPTLFLANAAAPKATGNTVRNQQVLQEVQINEDKLGLIEAVYASPRVVTQTPKTGALVARGSVVNLVLANGRNLLADVVTGGAQIFQGKPLGLLYDQLLKEDSTMTALVAKYGENQVLSEAERTQVERTLVQKGVEVGAEFDGVMKTLGASYTFNSQAI
jgi:hypothetical protein